MVNSYTKHFIKMGSLTADFHRARCVQSVTFLFMLCFASVASEEELWTNLQTALTYFDNPFFKASSHDVSAKAQQYLGKESLSFVVSPLWLELLLITISLGTSGKTLQELNEGTFLNMCFEEKENVLSYYMNHLSTGDQNLKLEIENMMFIKKDLRVTDYFKNIATKTFNMSISSLDFVDITESVKALNTMVASQTKRKMKEIFDESDLDPSGTSVIFVSSVYYKNRWLYPPTVLNGTWDFILSRENVTHTKVKMYRVNGIMSYGYDKDLDAQIVDIPFITPGISMLVFLPRNVGGLLPLEERVLEHQNLLAYAQNLMQPTPVAVSLPRFALEMAVLLPGKLEKMGIKNLFSKEAQLNRMIVGSKNVPVTNAIQRIKLWADAGRGAFKDTGDEELPIAKEIVFANHPFLFIIKMNNTSFMMGHFYV